MMRTISVLSIVNSALCLMIIFGCLSILFVPGIGLYAARVTGESMLPALPADAILVLAHIQPEVGDIVHVKYRGHDLAHRLVAINGESVTTKGDNTHAMEVASLDNVMGVVIFSSPSKSFIFLALLVVFLECIFAMIWARRLLFDIKNR